MVSQVSNLVYLLNLLSPLHLYPISTGSPAEMCD